MVRRSVPLLLLALLPCGSLAQGNVLAVEREYKAELREAEATVSAKTAELVKRRKEFNRSSEALEKAVAEVAQRERARRAADARIRALGNAHAQRTKRIRAAIARVQVDIRALKKDLARSRDAAATGRLTRELRARKRNLRLLQRQETREKTRSRIAERTAAAKRDYERVDNAYWAARRTALAPGRANWEAERRVRHGEEELAEATDALLTLRLQGPERLSRAAPPLLRRVVVTDKGGTVRYESEWQDVSSRVSKQLEICREAIREHRVRRTKLRKARDDLMDTIVDIDRRWHVQNRKYMRQTWNEGLGRTGIELFDAAVSIVWSDRKFVQGNLFFEAVYRVGKFGVWWFGGQSPYFSFPKIPITPTGTTAGAIGANAIKESAHPLRLVDLGLKAQLQEAINQMVHRTGPLGEARRRHGIWAAMQSEIVKKIFGDQRKEVVRDLNKAWNYAAIQRTKAVGEMRAALRSAGFQKQAWKGFGKGLAVSLGAEAAKAWMADKRLKTFVEMNVLDHEYRLVVADLRSAARQWHFERKKSRMLDEILEELLKERAQARHSRVLVRKRDQPLKGNGSLRLEFSRPVKEVKATFGNRALALAASGSTVTAPIEVQGLPGLATLVVDAKDALSGKALDADASSRARIDAAAGWQGHDKGPDRSHRIRLKGVGGVSVVVLIDGSGSMAKLFAVTKAAVLNLISLPDWTEMSIWTFRDSRVLKLSPFTDDRAQLAGAVIHLAAGGDTPLAEAITSAGGYLLARARFPKRILIVVSDGIDTMNGSPASALRRLHAIARNGGRPLKVETRGW